MTDASFDTDAVLEAAPPPPANRSPKEFAFAERMLKQMVIDSEIFPEEAARADWLWPLVAGDERTRRPSIDSAASTAASTVASTPSFDLPDEEAWLEGPSDEACEDYSSVPLVHEKDVDCGAVLGTGGVCVVRVAKLRGERKLKGGSR